MLEIYKKNIVRTIGHVFQEAIFYTFKIEMNPVGVYGVNGKNVPIDMIHVAWDIEAVIEIIQGSLHIYNCIYVYKTNLENVQ